MRRSLVALLALSLVSPAMASKPDLTKEPVVAHFVIATLNGLPYPDGELDPMPDAETMAYLATLKGCKYVDVDELSREGSVGVKWDCGKKKIKYNGVELRISNGKITKILPSQVSSVSF